MTYLRNGGNRFYLSKILGHNSVTATQKYLQSAGVDDLQAVHHRSSPLAPRRAVCDLTGSSGPLKGSGADPRRFHQRLFFSLCRDIDALTIHQNSVPAKELLDLVADFAPAEYNALEGNKEA